MGETKHLTRRTITANTYQLMIKASSFPQELLLRGDVEVEKPGYDESKYHTSQKKIQKPMTI